ncbi:LysR family transcriptional regulator [Rhodophyticola sp.]|uniref:LysR family transcriptional regulator n=1 Tax=Rhodophyticola sp. TaxID=2680032 RepID=UPI003D2A65DE
MASDFETVAWDDLRICLEVRRAGAVSTAARRLGLSHSTVLRRIAAMERSLGVVLFVKRTDGYVATDAGRDLAEAAEQVEARIATAMTSAAAFEAGMAGMIRFAVPDLAATVLMPLLAAFCVTHPDVEISLLAAQTPESLTRGDAHVALALTKSPPAGQIGVNLGKAAFAPYAARSALDQDEEQDLPWIGLTSGLRHTPVGGLDRAATAARRRLHRVGSLAMQYAAIAGGLGAGLLPCAVGDLDARLRRCGEPVTDPSQQLWLLYRPEMRGNIRIMTFFRYLRVALKRERLLIAGERPIS